MTYTPKLERAGYGRYRVVSGPAAGTIIERTTNAHALPCFRWRAIDGPGAFKASTDGHTLRGLAEALSSTMGNGR